jgi:hypothetical protein
LLLLRVTRTTVVLFKKTLTNNLCKSAVNAYGAQTIHASARHANVDTGTIQDLVVFSFLNRHMKLILPLQ